jgi:hypothetical protein
MPGKWRQPGDERGRTQSPEVSPNATYTYRLAHGGADHTPPDRQTVHCNQRSCNIIRDIMDRGVSRPVPKREEVTTLAVGTSNPETGVFTMQLSEPVLCGPGEELTMEINMC